MPRSALLVAAVVALAALAVFLFVRPGLPTGPQPPPQPVPPPRPERCFLVIEGPEGYPVWVNGSAYRLPVRLEYPCPLARFELLANETYRLNDTARYEFKAWRLGEKRVESRAARLTAVHNTTLVLEAELVKTEKKEEHKPRLKAVPAREAIDWGSVAPLEDEEKLRKEGYIFEWWVRGYTVYASGILVKLPLKRPLRILRIENVKLSAVEPAPDLNIVYLVFEEKRGSVVGVKVVHWFIHKKATWYATIREYDYEVLPSGEYVEIHIDSPGLPTRLDIDVDRAYRESYFYDLGYEPGDVAYIAVSTSTALDFSEAVFWVAEED